MQGPTDMPVRVTLQVVKLYHVSGPRLAEIMSEKEEYVLAQEQSGSFCYWIAEQIAREYNLAPRKVNEVDNDGNTPVNA